MSLSPSFPRVSYHVWSLAFSPSTPAISLSVERKSRRIGTQGSPKRSSVDPDFWCTVGSGGNLLRNLARHRDTDCCMKHPLFRQDNFLAEVGKVDGKEEETNSKRGAIL